MAASFRYRYIHASARWRFVGCFELVVPCISSLGSAQILVTKGVCECATVDVVAAQNWKRRYFVLYDDDKLVYFANSSDYAGNHRDLYTGHFLDGDGTAEWARGRQA